MITIRRVEQLPPLTHDHYRKPMRPDFNPLRADLVGRNSFDSVSDSKGQ